MHKPKSKLENKMQKILWDFDIQMDHLILARRLDIILMDKKKRNCHKRKEKDIQILEPRQRIKKAAEHDGGSSTNCIWCTWNSPKRFGKKTWGTEN